MVYYEEGKTELKVVLSPSSHCTAWGRALLTASFLLNTGSLLEGLMSFNQCSQCSSTASSLWVAVTDPEHTQWGPKHRRTNFTLTRAVLSQGECFNEGIQRTAVIPPLLTMLGVLLQAYLTSIWFAFTPKWPLSDLHLPSHAWRCNKKFFNRENGMNNCVHFICPDLLIPAWSVID